MAKPTRQRIASPKLNAIHAPTNRKPSSPRYCLRFISVKLPSLPPVVTGQGDVYGHGGQFVLLQSGSDTLLRVVQGSGEITRATDADVDREIVHGVSAARGGYGWMHARGYLGNPLYGTGFNLYLAVLVGGEWQLAAGEVRPRQLLQREVPEHEKRRDPAAGDDRAGDAPVNIVWREAAEIVERGAIAADRVDRRRRHLERE